MSCAFLCNPVRADRSLSPTCVTDNKKEIGRVYTQAVGSCECDESLLAF